MDKLLAGYGEKIITPPLGIDLSGYGFYLERKAERVLDDLKARVLFLKLGKVSLILASLDLIGLNVEFSDSLRKKISLEYKVPFSNILLSCIHTHSGPATHALPGLGEMNEDYMVKVSRAIEKSVKLAAACLEPSQFSFVFEVIEPIGFNRRKRNFEGIDPFLKILIFTKKDKKIFLLSYACHPVVLGPLKFISADWPGALVREIERRGSQGIFFQGFCGDIDPVTNFNRWGEGSEEDLLLYGKILAERTFKAEQYAEKHELNLLRARERRIKLPLKVCAKSEIEKEAERFLKYNSQFPGALKFAEEWERDARQKHEAIKANPYLENIPVQAMAIGRVKVLGLPGEVFCEYGLALQKKWKPLLTLGYANGTVGYIPTRSAFHSRGDYACYCAPKFFSLFPFSPEIERIILRESTALLRSVSD